MEATARVIPWTSKSPHPKDKAGLGAMNPEPAPANPVVEFGALEGITVVIPDEQLDAFGTIFCSSPLRKGMTFEAYLVLKGFAAE